MGGKIFANIKVCNNGCTSFLHSKPSDPLNLLQNLSGERDPVELLLCGATPDGSPEDPETLPSDGKWRLCSDTQRYVV